jgi:drug/metabolite transporter (DMT)-like permease
MAQAATKSVLGSRLAVSQLVGTIAGLVITGIISQLVSSRSVSPFGLPTVVVGGLLFGLPFYAAAVLVLHNFTRSVLAHAVAWCLGIPSLILIGSFTAFPPDSNGVYWINLIPICALCSGAVFLLWLRKSPLEIDR